MEKEFYLKICDKISIRHKEYIENRIKTDGNCRLSHDTRRRIHHALNGKLKTSSSRDLLGIDTDLYRKWIECQMNPLMNWSNTEIEHVKLFCKFDVFKDEELREAFTWINTQPLLKHDHQQKGNKFNFLDYQLQFITSYEFIKLNEEGFNENFH